MDESKKSKKVEATDRRSVSNSQSKNDNTKSGSKNKSWGEYLQQRREQLRNDGRSSRGKRSYGNKRQSTESDRARVGTSIERSSEEVERESTRLEYKFTLQELKDSIPNDVLEKLLSGSFTPTDILVIKKKSSQEKFVEDMYIQQKNMPAKRIRKPKKKKLPSEIFEKYIGAKDIKTEGILGVYFSLYKKLFKEEDAEWNEKNIQKAKLLVNSLINDTGATKIEVVEYVKKIMILWHKRLVEGESFPNRRPSLALLFNGRRWYWSNRKLLYKQWSEY